MSATHPGSGGDGVAVGTWNLEWAPRSRRARIAERLGALGLDVLCATEADAGVLPRGGHLVESEPDYGYPLVDGRRKVILWSRWPLEDPDSVGDEGLPPGRFATCRTPHGPLRLVGVPWRDAHVRTGRRDRAPWQEHLAYLERLGPLLAARDDTLPTLVLGDVNQRVPRRSAPIRVAEALERALGDLVLATAGPLPGIGRQVIDHIAHSPWLSARELAGVDRHDACGGRLSDHDGVTMRLPVHPGPGASGGVGTLVPPGRSSGKRLG
jgi:hypothetical protein